MKNKSQKKSYKSQDWFQLAFETKGTLESCLDVVAEDLVLKLEFLNSIRKNLTTKEGNSDRLSELLLTVLKMEYSLSYRLGLLHSSNLGGWFKAFQFPLSQPFKSDIFKEAIFSPFFKDSIPTLKSQIRKSYEDGTIYPIPFTDKEPCLWLKLLELNKEFKYINEIYILKEKFTLTQSPLLIPSSIASEKVILFLKRLSLKSIEIKGIIETCYKLLWDSSIIFWNHLETKPNFNGQKSNKSYKKAPPPPKPYPHMTDTHLRTLNFLTLPNKVQLRSRYLEMAKQVHPDITGGPDEEFKILYKSFRFLEKIVEQ